MSYFNSFPYIVYPDLSGKQTTTVVQDITIRVILTNLGVKNEELFYSHTILDNETPEIISENYYGTYQYHWTILIVNNIFDIVMEWPMNVYDFSKYIDRKYGSSVVAMGQKVYKIYPYKDDREYIVPYSIFSTFPLEKRKETTMYDEELNLNEKKRLIKILRPEYIEKFVYQFNSLAEK